MNRFLLALLAVGLVSVAACGDGGDSVDSSTSSTTTTTSVVQIGDEVSDEHLIRQARTWVDVLGLAQSDPVVWRERFERACSEGVWDDQVATQLAEEFIDQDLTVSVRAPGLGPPSVADGAQALWIMAVDVCRDAFPDGEIEEGPPGL